LNRKLLVLMFFALLLMHAGALRNDFYWDDRPLILEGKLRPSLASIPDLFKHEMWYSVDLGERAPIARVDTYRPLSNLSFWIDSFLWDQNPVGFHLMNLVIHLGNLILLYLLVRKLASDRIALWTTLFFGLHPLTVECIHYISARTDSLANFFSILSIYFLISRPVSWRRDFYAGCSLIAGAMVKETALVALPIWLLFSISERRIRLIIPVATAAIYLFLRHQALGAMKAVHDSSHLIELMANYPRLVVRAAGMFLFPRMNMPMQEFAISRPPIRFGLWCTTTLFYVSLAVLLVYGWRHSKRMGAVLFWGLLALAAPFVATSLTEVLNPRYLYPSVMAFSLGLVVLLYRLSIRPPIRVFAAVTLACLFGIRSLFASFDYRNGETFYGAILRDHPHHVEAEYSLANTLFRSRKFEQAALLYREVLRHQPQNPSAMNNLGSTYLALNQNEPALAAFESALKSSPNNLKYKNNLEIARKKLGKEVP
jgi:protein O-mannosyl-transferase